MRAIRFKTAIKRGDGGREYVALPKTIAAHHCHWVDREFYRKKTLRTMHKAGLLPPGLYLDDLPDHVTVERPPGVLASVVVWVPDGA
ncbi:hypothetical protein K0U83_23445 [bacterium]|nr:hypothetical protein [bacterium]